MVTAGTDIVRHEEKAARWRLRVEKVMSALFGTIRRQHSDIRQAPDKLAGDTRCRLRYDSDEQRYAYHRRTRRCAAHEDVVESVIWWETRRAATARWREYAMLRAGVLAMSLGAVTNIARWRVTEHSRRRHTRYYAAYIGDDETRVIEQAYVLRTIGGYVTRLTDARWNMSYAGMTAIAMRNIAEWQRWQYVKWRWHMLIEYGWCWALRQAPPEMMVNRADEMNWWSLQN